MTETYEPSLLRLSFLTIQSCLHQASWADVLAKAKRLIFSGQVNVIRNTPKLVTGVVEGDHGIYKSAISRNDPDSQAIEQWICECPWHQYAFQRTRQWQKLDGRVCSHVMALYMKARSTPLDTTGEEEGYQPGKGQRLDKSGPGQLSMPIEEQIHDQKLRDQGLTRDQVLQMQQQEDLENPLPLGTESEDEESTSPSPITPEKTDAIPTPPPVPEGQGPVLPGVKAPSEMRPGTQPLYQQMTLWDATIPNPGGPGLPPLNPVSIPGGRPPTPTNPMNQPGTFSRVASLAYSSTSEFAWHYSKENNSFEEWAKTLLARGYTPTAMVSDPSLHLETRGGKIPVPGAAPVGLTEDGIPQYRTLDLGWNPTLQRRMNADEGGPHGPGAPELRGQFVHVPPGMAGEVTAIEPEFKSAYVRFPARGSGPLHPKSIEGWVDFKHLAPHPDQRSPFRPRR